MYVYTDIDIKHFLFIRTYTNLNDKTEKENWENYRKYVNKILNREISQNKIKYHKIKTDVSCGTPTPMCSH